MNKLIVLIVALFFLNNCSLKENLYPTKDKEKKLETQTNIKKLFLDNNKVVIELNPELKLDLTKININNKIIDNKNNYGPQNYDGNLNKTGNYKFSKLDGINQLNFKPIYLKDGLIFFDKRGSIIRYNNKQNIIWKNNFYSKLEKKLKPKLNFVLDNENLLVADNIAKYYSININSGKLNWSKNNTYPFNSEIKKYKKKNICDRL